MNDFVHSVLGDLGAYARVWAALAPAILVASYFLVGFVIYGVRYLVKGPYRDPEMEARGSTVLAGMYLRLYFAWLMQPVWRLVLRTGVPATAITTLSVLIATAAGVSMAMGRFALGGWLYIASGICDFLDGRLARARKTVTRSGAALDSILDRYSDSAVLVGLAWYYRGSWVLLATQLALVGSSLVPYIRARGEAIGVSIKEVGFMQRAERIMYLGVAVAMSPVVELVLSPGSPDPLQRLAVVGVVLLAVSTQITALQRFIHLIGALDPRAWDIGWVRLDRGSRARGLFAAVTATAADFFGMFALVRMADAPVPLAVFTGAVVGAMAAFLLHRMGTYGIPGARLVQLGRYGFAVLTAALLNAGGVAVLMLMPGVDFRIAWALVHVAVFLAWNFPLYRAYLFQADEAPAVAAPAQKVG